MINAPEELKAYPNWVAWNRALNDKKPLRLIDGNGAASNKPQDWATFDVASNFISHRPHYGVGFELTDTPFVCIDLDDPRDPKHNYTPEEIADIEAIHQRILAACKDTYIERSPSGNGYHVWGSGTVPKGKKDKCVEIYGDDRYFTVTGDAINSNYFQNIQKQIDVVYNSIIQSQGIAPNPTIVADVAPTQPDDVIAAKVAATSPQLWNCDPQQCTKRSDDDFALMKEIARVSRNKQQTFNVFMKSPRANTLRLDKTGDDRDKCNKRPKYVTETVDKAFASVDWSTGTFIDNMAPLLANPFQVKQPALFNINDCDLDSVITNVMHFKHVEVSFAIEGMIPDSGVTAITGGSGCGKTTVVEAISKAVVTGTPFLGCNTVQRKVLYMDAENSLPIVQERLKRLNFPDTPNLMYIGQFNNVGFPAFNSPSVINWIKKNTPRPLVVIDSYSAFFGHDEAATDKIRAFFSTLDQIKTLGCSIIIIHHTGKGESTKPYRGGTAFKDAIDVMYEMTNSSNTRLENLKLKAEKMRVTVREEINFTYREGDFVLVDEDASAQTNITHKQFMNSKLLDLLADNPHTNKTYFINLATTNLNLSREQVRRFIQNGIETKTIVATKAATNNSVILQYVDHFKQLADNYEAKLQTA